MAIAYQRPPAGTVRSAVSSECVVADGWAFVNGVGPVDLVNDRIALPELVEAQVRKTLANLEAILAQHGMTRDHVVSVRVHLVDHARLHERLELGYAGFFAAACRPARSVIGVSHLPRGALVNMDVVARNA